MNRTRNKFLLVIGLMMLLGSTAVFANDNANSSQNRGPKDTAILSIKTSPDPFIVRIDGVQVGMSGVENPAEFYITPGNHRVEVEAPNGKVFARDYNFKKNTRQCICLKSIEERTERPCPYDVRVQGPDKIVEGAEITFVAVNAISSSVPLKYVWHVTPDSAKITSGLGTPSITVDTRGIGKQTVNAYVDVTDDVYGATCQQKNSTTTEVEVQEQPQPLKFDAFDSKSFDDDKAHFDNFSIQLQSIPDSQAYIIMYQGTDKVSVTTRDVNKLSKKALDYLVKARGIDPRRIQITKWGTREHTSYELWLVPPGSQPPVPDQK